VTDKEYLIEEIAQVKKALRSLSYQYTFWQRRASLSNKKDDLMQLGNVTASKTGTEEYIKFLEGELDKQPE
jgi:hypothetical protein